VNRYTLEFRYSGEILEGHFATDAAAEAWAVAVLERQGYDVDTLEVGGYDSDGTDEDGHHVRKLYWASAADADNDPGAASICQLCTVRPRTSQR